MYLDEDVSVFVAQLLRPHGFEVLTTRDAQNLSRSDAAQLQFAVAHQRTILTHNRCDYERLHEAALREQHSHSGILIANRRASDFELARRTMGKRMVSGTITYSPEFTAVNSKQWFLTPYYFPPSFARSISACVPLAK